MIFFSIIGILDNILCTNMDSVNVFLVMPLLPYKVCIIHCFFQEVTLHLNYFIRSAKNILSSVFILLSSFRNSFVSRGRSKLSLQIFRMELNELCTYIRVVSLTVATDATKIVFPKNNQGRGNHFKRLPARKRRFVQNTKYVVFILC